MLKLNWRRNNKAYKLQRNDYVSNLRVVSMLPGYPQGLPDAFIFSGMFWMVY